MGSGTRGRRAGPAAPRLTAGVEARHAHHGSSEELAELRRRISWFRYFNAPRTRIPDELRKDVVLALGRGVPMVALQRELGLTPKQLEAWRLRFSATLDQIEVGEDLEAPRVFEIADADEGQVLRDGDEALEIRVGPWSIVIRSTRS